jgi:hypothetical protein
VGLVAGRSDVVEFGRKNYDAVIYASRTAEALTLSAALAAGGFMVRDTTRSTIAAMLFGALRECRRAALRDDTHPREPDGFLRYSWNGIRSQGRIR